MTTETGHPETWPLRAAFFAVLGASVGLAIWALTDGGSFDAVWRVGLAVFAGTAALAFAYTLERGRAVSSILFALAAGAITGFVVYWNGDPKAPQSEVWRLACGAVTVAVAVPLFMAWRTGPGGRAIPYVAAHDRAWTSTMLWFASWAFTGLVFLLAWLLASLFDLIGIDALTELLRKDWFTSMLIGAALGGAIGLLRDREAILSTLQRVVMTVLSVLAPVLAAGLILFLLALPFTGLTPLWSATKSTTPILLACVAGALLLINAVIGDTPEDEARNPALRYSAMALGFAMIPLGIIAAVSTGLRIQQYGLTPDRLWAVVFTGIGCAYGLVYLVSLARKRRDWSALLRPGNMRMAVAVCVIAFVLAMPFISFGALSTRDQVARLLDGRTPASKFDWAALRFDFGPSGKAAAEALAKSGKTVEIRTAAAAVLAADNRWEARGVIDTVTFDLRVIILPKRVALPAGLRAELSSSGECSGTQTCVLLYAPEASEAVLTNGRWTSVFASRDGKWRPADRFADVTGSASDAELKRGPVVVRDVKRRQVFVGSKAIGQPFE